jgi:hypothetical protein
VVRAIENDDGTFGIERDGTPLPGCRWDAQRLSLGVRTFRDIERDLHRVPQKFEPSSMPDCFDEISMRPGARRIGP